MVNVVVMPFLVVEAASGVNARLLQPVGYFIQPFAGDATYVKQAVTVVLVQQFHDMGGVQFAGKVEIYFAEFPVWVTYFTAGVYDGQGVGIQFEVAETGLQQVDAIEAHGEKRKGQRQTSPRLKGHGA